MYFIDIFDSKSDKCMRCLYQTLTSHRWTRRSWANNLASCQTVAWFFWVAEKLSKHSFLFSESFARMIACIAWNEPGSIPNTPDFAHHSSVVRVMRIYSFERCVKSLDAESFLGKPAKLIFNHYNEKKKDSIKSIWWGRNVEK